MELSVLCDVNVLIVVFDPKIVKASVYSTSSPELLIQKLKSLPQDNVTNYSPYIDFEEAKDDL